MHLARVLLLLVVVNSVTLASAASTPALNSLASGMAPLRRSRSKSAARPASVSPVVANKVTKLRGGNTATAAAAAATVASAGGSTGILAMVKAYADRVPLHATKVAMQLALTALNVLCWIIPLQSKNFAQNTSLLSLASCFSGGVFLSLSLTHLLPHAVEEMEGVKGANKAHTYLAVLLGYLLVLFIDKVAFNAHDLLHTTTAVDGIAAVANANPTTADPFSALHGGSDDLTAVPSMDELAGAGAGGDSTVAAAASASAASHGAIVLLIAMGVHSLLETMALGLAQDKRSAVMMAASIGLHQPAETLALLVAFIKTGMSQESVIKYLTAFSVIGPLGVSMGVFIKKIASARIDALIVAVTAGTFIYMGATEIVSEEFEHGSPKDKYARFMAILAGVLTILGLTNYSDAWEASASAR